MPVTFSVPITQWYVGETLPVPTIFYTDDSGVPITLTGAFTGLTLTIRNRASGPGGDTTGAGTFTIVTTLAALTGATINAGAAVTALPCATGTSVALPPASTVICSTAGNAETFTYSGAVPLAAGAISIPVVSQVAGKTHTAADSISGLGLATYAWASGDVATVGQYLLYFKVTMSGGGLYVEDPVPWNVNAF